MRRLFGCCLSLLAIAIPATAGAQQLHPCTPIAPGVRCASPVAQPWGRLDFGAPKTAVYAWRGQLSERWPEALFQHRNMNVPFRELLRRRSSDTSTLTDCSAIKHLAPRSELQMAPALPPLPAVQPVLIPHGHTSMPAPVTDAIVSPCKGK